MWLLLKGVVGTCYRLVCDAAGGGPRLRAAHSERDGAAGSRSGAAVRGGPPRQIQGKENVTVSFASLSSFYKTTRARERAPLKGQSLYIKVSSFRRQQRLAQR